MGLFDKLRGKNDEQPSMEPTGSVQPAAPVPTIQTAPITPTEQTVPIAPIAQTAPTVPTVTTDEPQLGQPVIVEPVQYEPASTVPAQVIPEQTLPVQPAPDQVLSPVSAAPDPINMTATAAPLAAPALSNMLAIGDIFTDAFIHLSEEAAKIITEADGSEWLALPFGQKPPYEQVDIIRSVGPSPNAAVSMARLGLTVGLQAWVGDDPTGAEAIQHLKNERVGTEEMTVEAGKKTSYWYVLRYGADRTMLVKSEKYTYQWQDPAVVPDWIYLAYIGEDSWPLHEQLADYLTRNPSVKFALQPGTFHFEWGTERMAPLYSHAHITIMNREEAADVTGRSPDSIHDLAAGLHLLGPKIVVITDGKDGSFASYDGKVVTIPNYPDPAPPLDRTGAGDAFASTIVTALAHGETMETALTWAPINSMSVVQQLGAQAGLLDQATILSHLAAAPANYQVTELPAGV